MTEETFATYHENNPEVYAKLREYALAAKRLGHAHIGIHLLHERVRWYTTIETTSDCPFRLNNNNTPYYARLLMEQEPELRGFFHTRTSVADMVAA